MNYYDLTLNQRIAIKGMIETEGKRLPFHKMDHTDLSLLKCIWILSDFREAVNAFLYKYVNEK